MKNKIFIVVGGLLVLLLLLLVVRNCRQVKEVQPITKGVIEEKLVLDSISNFQKHETFKKDSTNSVIDTMSATSKRKRAKDIFKRRKKQRLGFAEAEDDECRKLLIEERQSNLRRVDRRLYKARQRAQRKNKPTSGRKDTKQVSIREARKPPNESEESEQETKVA